MKSVVRSCGAMVDRIGPPRRPLVSKSLVTEAVGGPAFLSIAMRKWSSILLLVGTIAFTAAAPCLAQAGGNIPTIRVEANEVVVPTFVFGTTDNGDFGVEHLSATDFRLFEDGAEQKIERVSVERGYAMFLHDSLGVVVEGSLTPKVKWSALRDKMVGVFDVGPGVVYLIAYVPPPSALGSCHELKVSVTPRDANGGRYVIAENEVDFGKGVKIVRAKVKRSQLSVDSRTEYCNTAHASSDPLYGTEVSKQMESYSGLTTAVENGFSLQASTFYMNPGSARVHVALDFEALGEGPDLARFDISLLGMAYKTDGSPAARFSDSRYDSNCYAAPKPEAATIQSDVCREITPNHYETQIDLSPGVYHLQVVTDFRGKLRRVQVPMTVDSYDGQHLAISGIALCKRFHEHKEMPQTSPPVMPLELVPLVSKGIEFTPTGDTHFKKQEPVIAYFEVYEPSLAGAGAANVQFQMRITDAKTGEVKSDTGLQSAESWMRPANSVIAIAKEFARDKLPPGEYRLEVQASDSAGNRTPWRTASFTVE